MSEVGNRKTVEEAEVVADAIQADVGDASGSTLTSLYAILGNPSASVAVSLLDDIDGRTNNKNLNALLGVNDAAGKSINGNIGDFQAHTNDQTLLDKLGLPDEASGSLYERLGAFTSTESLKDIVADLVPHRLYYPFNHPQAAVDVDYWTAAGDAGGFIVITAADEPPSRKLYADTAQNNDYYIHGDAKYNMLWNFQAADYTKIVFECKLKFVSTAEVQALWGLFEAGGFPVDTQQPLVDCAHFILDDGVDTNFVCRTYDAAEQETNSDIALDTSAHVYLMEWTTASVIFKIDGVTKATHSTQVPDSPMGLVFSIRTEEAAGAEKSMSIEYVKVHVE